MGLFQRGKTNDMDDNAGESSQASATTSAPQLVQQPLTAADYRRVFLLVWANAKQKAHWGIFVPHKTDKTWKSGKFYHVEGSLRDGFDVAIVRGWDISKTRRRPESPIELGWIPDSMVFDIPSKDERHWSEDIPRDQIDQFFASIPAPSPSLNSATGPLPSIGGKVLRNVDLSDCQWWVTKCISALVDQGIMIPPLQGSAKGKKALETLASAPRH